MIGQAGVYWPFKTLLQGSGISITEDGTSIRITNTGGTGGGSGDMLQSQYAPSGISGKVDHALLADSLASGATVPLANQANSVPWSGITGVPTSFPSDWSVITNKPSAFQPITHAPTHLPNGSDPIALATVNAPGLLAQVSGNTTDFIDGTNNPQPLTPAVTSIVDSLAPAQIWSVRLRSYSALGNANFEVTARRGGGSVTGAGGRWAADRWFMGNNTGVSLTDKVMSPNLILVPGTNYAITNSFHRVTLAGTKTVLAAADVMGYTQYIEGPMFRELASDVHSISLLVRTSVPNLTIAISLRDGNPSSTQSLVLFYTITTANQWTLIQLPNLPVWPSAGNFSTQEGAVGCLFSLYLAVGSNYWEPGGGQGVWQSGNFVGGSNQSNFLYGPVGSTFDFAFAQHEPGNVCTTFIDKPFQQNFHDCQRYYETNYPYNVLPGTSGSFWRQIGMAFTNYARLNASFKKSKAKTPSVVLYTTNGTANQVYVDNINADTPISSISATTEHILNGVLGINIGNAWNSVLGCWTADTGW